MLRAVVLVGSAHIGHKRGEGDIADENSYSDKTLDESAEEVACTDEPAGEEVKTFCGEGWEHEEHDDTDCKSEYHADTGDDGHELIAELIAEPFFKLGFGLFGIDSLHFRGFCEHIHGQFKLFDERDDTADEWECEEFMFFSEGGEGRVIDGDFSVGSSDSEGAFISGFHHNAFEDSLTADDTDTRVNMGFSFHYIFLIKYFLKI